MPSISPDLEVITEDHWGLDTREGLDPASFPWSEWLQCWLGHTWQTLPPAFQQDQYELTLRFTSDEEIEHLNHQYRGMAQPTDVLSFATLDGDSTLLTAIDEPLYLGDIVISVPTALRQAQQRGHSLTQELPWLAAHGFLHLLGWDHPDEDSLERMLNQQIWLLQQVGLTFPNGVDPVASVNPVDAYDPIDSVPIGVEL